MMNLNRQYFVGIRFFVCVIGIHFRQNTTNIKISLHLSEQLNVKILFVDDHASLQEKWIEPLRGEGWGVVRTRSSSDAEKVFEFHGDSLSALVVSEANAEWASKWNIPYIVLKTTWKDVQVMKHQNGAATPAVAYLDFDTNIELLKQAIQDSKNKVAKKNLKSTGTDFISTPSSMLAPIESVAAPSESANDQHEGVVIQLDLYSNQAAVIESTSLKKPEPKVQQPEVQHEEIHHEEEVPVSLAVEGPVASDDNATRIFDASALIDMTDDDDNLVPNEMLSAAVVELGGEPLAKPVEAVDATKVEDVVGYSFDDVQEVEEVEEVEEVADDYVSEVVVAAPAEETYMKPGKDLETMKSYLALREQDVALLTGQMRSTQERVHQLEALLKVERNRSAELTQTVQKQEQQIKSFERDKQVEFEVLFNQVEDLNHQLRERTDKARAIETKLKITTDEVEKVKERVRLDIRRIRVREKELENQLEILKKDSTALLMARDEKILELKRKIDLIEFNMELVQEQYNKERNVSEQLRLKLKEAAGAVKRAGGLLDQEN